MSTVVVQNVVLQVSRAAGVDTCLAPCYNAGSLLEGPHMDDFSIDNLRLGERIRDRRQELQLSLAIWLS